MRFLSLLLILCAGLFLTGCETTAFGPIRYYRVVTMDLRGNLIASWTSKGRVVEKEGGYHFTAMERCVPNPPREYRYPLGWRVRVLAPRVVIYEMRKPYWLEGLTPWHVAQHARTECQHTVLSGEYK